MSGTLGGTFGATATAAVDPETSDGSKKPGDETGSDSAVVA